MVPDGGALTPALRLLGYNPYTLEHSVRKGQVLSHPQEWTALLHRHKSFDTDLLKAPAAREGAASPDAAAAPTRQPTTAVAASQTPPHFDAFVGPPATIAFEAILKACPRSTRVVLVEEPDKLAWEKDMEQWLQPLVRQCESRSLWLHTSKLHNMLLDMVDLRRALLEPGGGRPGLARAAPSSFASRTAQNVPIAQQHKTLSLAGALDLFEQHVKDVVPRDRLLVYRVQDGWQPLCAFLQVPVPTQPAREGPAASATPVPFPANTNGRETLVLLQQGLQKSTAVVTLLFLCVVALGLLVLSCFTDEYRQFYRDYRDYVHRDVVAQLDTDKDRDASEARATVREVMVVAKKSSRRFGEEYQKQGGAVQSMSGVVQRLVNPPSSA